MKKTYIAPEIEIIKFTPARSVMLDPTGGVQDPENNEGDAADFNTSNPLNG